MYEGSSESEKPFVEGEHRARSYQRVRQSLFSVRAPDPGGTRHMVRGTAVMIATADTGMALYATAAHVLVDERTGEPWYALSLSPDGSDECLPASKFTGSARPERQWWDPDFAIITTASTPESTQAARVRYELGRVAKLLEPGTTVLYAGYALPLDDEGRPKPMLAEGMIAGDQLVHGPNGIPHFRRYVLNGMVSRGMSGGPLFCPHTSDVAAIVTAAVADSLGTGHGWGYALPVDLPLAVLESMMHLRSP